MDFSVLQGNARHKLLRDITALRPVWIYYLIMAVDPILRFSWIFYAIFTHDAQHSTIVSFLVSLAEVVRRGMWTLLRVENEHCANVAQYKASRDTPLPYHLENFVQRPSLEEAAAAATASSLHRTPSAMDGGPAPTTPKTPRTTVPPQHTSGTASSQRQAVRVPTPLSEATAEFPAPAMPSTTTGTATALEGGGGGPGTFRRRRTDTVGKRSILQAMAEAHKQDFEKRRVPAGEEKKDLPLDGDEEDDEEEEEELKSEEERIEEEEDEEEEEEESNGSSREGGQRRPRGGLRRMGTRAAREGSGDRGLMPDGGGGGGHKGPDDTF
jgi:hypothetical protein